MSVTLNVDHGLVEQIVLAQRRNGRPDVYGGQKKGSRG